MTLKLSTFKGTRGFLQDYGDPAAVLLVGAYDETTIDPSDEAIVKVTDLASEVTGGTYVPVELTGVEWDLTGDIPALRADDTQIDGLNATVRYYPVWVDDHPVVDRIGDLVAVLEITPALVVGDQPIEWPGGKVADLEEGEAGGETLTATAPIVKTGVDLSLAIGAGLEVDSGVLKATATGGAGSLPVIVADVLLDTPTAGQYVIQIGTPQAATYVPDGDVSAYELHRVDVTPSVEGSTSFFLLASVDESDDPISIPIGDGEGGEIGGLHAPRSTAHDEAIQWKVDPYEMYGGAWFGFAISGPIQAEGGGAVDSVNGQTGTVVLDADDFADGTTNHVFTAADDTKLTGIASGATANQSDATTNAAIALKADLASPALTGNPTAPTQTAGNNSTRLATTAYADTGRVWDRHILIPSWQKPDSVTGTWVWVQVNSASGGYGNSGSTNTQVWTYTDLALDAGTWALDVWATTFNGGGIATFTLGGTGIGTVDTYTVATVNSALTTLTGITVSTAGRVSLVITNPTKNATPSTYTLRISALVLRRTGP